MKTAIGITITGPARSGRSSLAKVIHELLLTYGIQITNTDPDAPLPVGRPVLASALEAIGKTAEVTIATGDVRPQAGPDADGWEWAIVEVFGHRRHVGRSREEEKFGSKLCRIDVPVLGPGEGEITWSSHFYSGGSIFSYTPTDEQTVMNYAERRKSPPLLYRDHGEAARPSFEGDDEFSDEDEHA